MEIGTPKTVTLFTKRNIAFKNIASGSWSTS